MSIVFNGLEDVLEMLERPVDAQVVNKALNKACLLVERRARQLAPKGKTGDLRKFMSHKVEEDFKGVVFNPLEYAPYVEYGTGLFSTHPMGGRTDVPWAYEDEETGELIWTCGQHPQPFMRPALDENRETIVRILKEGITGND